MEKAGRAPSGPSGAGASARRQRDRSAPAHGAHGAHGAREAAAVRSRRRLPVAAVLSALCLLAAAAAALLVWRPPDRPSVDPGIFTAARENVEAVYRYDYRDSEGSLADQLDTLTGELRTRYETEAQNGLIDTFEQVSATIRYEVVDIGLQQVADDQEEATLVVFGQWVADSVNTGSEPAPPGSECVVTPEGEQSCVRTVQIRMLQVDGDWKISELTVLTTG